MRFVHRFILRVEADTMCADIVSMHHQRSSVRATVFDATVSGVLSVPSSPDNA